MARLEADDIISVNADGVARGKAWLMEAYRTGAVRDELMESDDRYPITSRTVAMRVVEISWAGVLTEDFEHTSWTGRLSIQALDASETGG